MSKISQPKITGTASGHGYFSVEIKNMIDDPDVDIYGLIIDMDGGEDYMCALEACAAYLNETARKMRERNNYNFEA